MSTAQARSMETTLPAKRAGVMDEEVADLLAKGAIEKAGNDPGFYSRVFLVPKKSGKLRPIIHLKPLNRFVRAPHFSMTTLKDVCELVQEGDWAVCLDMKDTYFHLRRSKKENHRKSVQSDSNSFGTHILRTFLHNKTLGNTNCTLCFSEKQGHL